MSRLATDQLERLHAIGVEHGLLPLGTESAGVLEPRRAARRAKRLLDITVGSVLAVLAVPIVVAFAVAVGIALRANPFFIQRRVGEFGRDFTIVKLRTLPTSVPAYGDKHELGVKDMPLPLIARILRNTHLDELPQLFLVPFGRMSLVGPRPVQPITVEPVPPRVELMRTAIPQGCTGIWQISRASGGLASASPELDEFYLRHACLRLDLWILVRTVGYVLRLAKPIAAADIPAWVLGRGLVADDAPEAARPLTSTASTLPFYDVEAAVAD